MDTSELFSSYEKDYDVIYTEINHRISDTTSLGSSADQSASISRVERLVTEADELIDQMAIEVQSIPTGSRSAYNNKVRTHKRDLDKAKRELKQLDAEINRGALFGNRSTQTMPYSDDPGSNQRQELLQGQQSLERSSERLLESQRVANDTEGIGASILDDLRGQREQIINSRNTLTEADSSLDRSLRTLRGMARRMMANKFITYAIIAVLVLLIIFVIISKFW